MHLLTFICLWTLIEDTTRTKLNPYILKKCLKREERDEEEEEEVGNERREGGVERRGKSEVFIQPAKPHCLQWC